MTFTDRFFADKLVVPAPLGDLQEDIIEDITRGFTKAETIVANNVSDYYFTTAKDLMKFPADFPYVVPPFPATVVECRRPIRLLPEKDEFSAKAALICPSDWAVLFQEVKADSILTRPIAESVKSHGRWRTAVFSTHMRDFVENDEDLKLLEAKAEISPDAKVQLKFTVDDRSPYQAEIEKDKSFDMGSLRLVTATLFVNTDWYLLHGDRPKDIGLNRVYGPLAMWTWLADKYGYVVNQPRFHIPHDLEYMKTISPDYDPEGAKASIAEKVNSTLFFPAFMALSFLHCKNVVLTDNEPLRAERRRAAREGKKPPVTYKTLVVESMRTVSRKTGRPEPTDIKQGLHITRGHFKDYRGSKGLFGKYKGLYWWDAHLAGKSEEGTIVKTYEEIVQEKPG